LGFTDPRRLEKEKVGHPDHSFWRGPGFPGRGVLNASLLTKKKYRLRGGPPNRKIIQKKKKKKKKKGSY